MNNPKPTIQNPASYEAYLLGLPRFADRGTAAIHPGLAHIEALMEAMGRPHEAFESVHLAGTNGKGSTASLLAAIATASGRRVGLHTSPHLIHLSERLRLDGVPAPASWIADAVARFRPVIDDLGASFFEVMTALSLLYFAEENVDLAVVEVGLGGRLDATNVLQPRLAIITNIALEHTDFLGETLVEIAQEKAGIIKPGVPLLTAADQPEVRAVICAEAAANETSYIQLQDDVQVLSVQPSLKGLTLQVRTPVRRYDALEVSLPGFHQQINAALALRAAELLFDDLHRDPTAIYNGLREVRRLAGLRGRLEVLQHNPLVIADVAHNPHSLRTTLAFIQTQRDASNSQLFVLLGAMRDKDVAEMARALAEAQTTVYPLLLDSDRALPPAELAAILRAQNVNTLEGGSLAAGWPQLRRLATPSDVLLFTGSHQVVTQAWTLLAPLDTDTEDKNVSHG